jgi:hypothetical protein
VAKNLTAAESAKKVKLRANRFVEDLGYEVAMSQSPQVEAYLHSHEQSEIARLEAENNWQPWRADANNPMQQAAVRSIANTIGLGGAGGAGKSAAILVLANQHRQTLILRRTFKRLNAIIKNAIAQYRMAPGASYNSNDKVYHHIPGDRTIQFGHCEHEKDKESYRGHDHDLKAFDELTEFSRSQFEFIRGWNRSSDIHQLCRTVATFNPPSTLEGRWVVDYFAPWIDPRYEERTGRKAALPGEVRWFVVNTDEYGNPVDVELEPEQVKLFIILEGGRRIPVREYAPIGYRGKIYYPQAEDVEIESGKQVISLQPSSRTFIPGRLSDNKYLRDSNYRSVLMSFPEPLRSQLLEGRFDIDIERDDRFQIIPSAWVKAAMRRWTPEPPTAQTHIAADISWGGRDRTVLGSRHDIWHSRLKVLPKSETHREDDSQIEGDRIAREIMRMRESKQVEVRIDGMGVGTTAFDSCKRYKMKPVCIVFGGSSYKLDEAGKVVPCTDRTGNIVFKDKRTEMLWNMRELLDPTNDFAISLPPDRELHEELCAHRWHVTQKIGMQIEIKANEKDEVKRIIGRSPDKSDTVIMNFAVNPSSSAWKKTNVSQTALDQLLNIL